jgi:hypothetical protein
LLADREVALRLATSREVDRKLRVASESRYFWVYALSLWDPDAFWQCVGGALTSALIGFFFMAFTVRDFIVRPLFATALFEYFLLGLILMWLYNLGAWLHPTNLKVIFTFIFRLYRKNKNLEDLSAEEIGRLFPAKGEARGMNLVERLSPSKLYASLEDSRVFGPLVVGSLFSMFLVLLLAISA